MYHRFDFVFLTNYELILSLKLIFIILYLSNESFLIHLSFEFSFDDFELDDDEQYDDDDVSSLSFKLL